MSKTLIITGGSKGIGKQTIAFFLEKNWQVINISRTPCELTNVSNILLDLSQPKTIEQLAPTLKAAVNKASQIALVHNAAYYNRDTVQNQDLAELECTLAISLLAPAVLNKIFIPLMKPGSAIIYIGSTLSEKAVPHSATYSTSKHAVIGLMRATCQDLNGQFIHTACVCPGITGTEMLRETMDQKTIDWFLTNKVIGKRLIDPAEIASIVYFCATSPVINGTIIHANLGQVAD